MKNQDLKLTNDDLQKQVKALTKKNESLQAQVQKAKEDVRKAKAEAKEEKAKAKKAEDRAKKAEDKTKKAQDELNKSKKSERRKSDGELRIDFTPIPRYKYTVQVIQLCVLLYVRLGCGLRTVVKILEIFSEVMGTSFGKIPCHKSIEDWVKKLGLSVYTNDPTPEEWAEYAMILDESILINKEKLLLTLAIPSPFLDHPVGHVDARILDMKVDKSFKGKDVEQAVNDAAQRAGTAPKYAITDQGSNLIKGLSLTEIPHFIDVSHAIGTCFKKTYEKQADFKELFAIVGRAHLQYQLTDSAYLLPPNMRAIARFMNMRQWVQWGIKMINSYEKLSQKERKDYAFVIKYKYLFEELNTGLTVSDYVENLLKKEGFSDRTAALCQHHIITKLFVSPNLRLLSLGLRLVDYIIKQRAKLPDKSSVIYISSDIIESSFGIFKAKKSPNKLYGVTPLVLMLPLYPKIVNKEVTKKVDFLKRLTDVRLSDIEEWIRENLSENMVTKRNKTLNESA